MTPCVTELLEMARKLAAADSRFAMMNELAQVAEGALYRCDALAVKVAKRNAELAAHNKVTEAARRYDEARIARPLLYAKKRAEYRLLDNLTVTYLREADEPLAQAQADLHEALAAIEEPRR